VDRVVPPEALPGQAQSLAERLAALPPTALALSKAVFAAAHRSDYLQWEAAQFATCWSSPEREKAMRAFLNKDK
jgi:enoyl-CoA hydratase/carnithine racemase